MPLPVLFRTTVFQLTILYVVFFGVSVAAIGIFVYRATVVSLARQTDEIIEAEMRGIDEQLDVRGLVDLIKQRSERQSVGERSAYLLVDPRLNRVAGNLDRWPPGVDEPYQWVDFEVGTGRTGTDEADTVPLRAYVQPIGRAGYRLLIGREVRELEQLKQTFRRASIVGLGITLTLALAGGLAIAYSAQRRVALLSRTTRQIIAGDLSRRVPVSRTHDEHAELAESVNAMLDQIGTLLSGMRHVGDSIAHDLRGPLTRLRSRLEMLAAEETPTRQSVDECLEQADGVLSTFNALLRISRIETGAYRRAFATIDLAPIVNDVAELYEATAEENLVEIRRRVEDNAVVFGDRELLAQALTNLVDNGLKYTPIGGHIDIELKKSRGRVVVIVADSGPGIPAAARGRVFQRFARLDEARSKPGNGLGLALVKAVSDQHDGELKLTDNGPGLRVTLSLPAAKAESETAENRQAGDPPTPMEAPDTHSKGV